MITDEQRIKRQSYIGSSDIACIVGCDPWRNIADLFLEKTGRLNGDKSSDAAELGTHLEGAILDMFENEKGVKTERHIWLSRDEGFPACANLDGAIKSRGRVEEYTRETESAFISGIKIDNTCRSIEAVVEAKSTSRQDEWDKQSGNVPLRVLTQTHWQMWLAYCEIAYAPVLFPDFGRFKFQIFNIPRNNDLIDELKYRADRFWNDQVLRDIPPPAVTPHLETLKRIRREPASTVRLDDEAAEILQALELAKRQRKACETAVEQHQAELLAMLGDAEAGSLPDGSMITYLEQNGARSCDWDRLEVELRSLGRFDLYERLVRQARFRVMRVKKAKSR